MRIRTKLVIAVGASMLVVAALAGTTIRAASERNIRLNAEAAIAGAGAAFAAVERADVAKLSVALAAILADPRYRPAFERRDRGQLAALAEPLFREVRARFGITHWYFHLPDRTVFLRVHKPEQYGDAVARPTLARAAETGELAAGKELGQNAFALRVVRPWVVDGARIGFVELGEEIDDFLRRMTRQTGDDYALLVEKEHLDAATFARVRAVQRLRNDWDDLPAQVLVDATAPGVAAGGWAGDPAALPAAGAFLGEVTLGDKVFARGALPVLDAAGTRVGVLLVRSDISAMHGNMTRARNRVLMGVALLTLLGGAFAAWSIDFLVLRRLRRMTGLLEDVATRLVGGDYDVASAIPPPRDRDEIGQFEAFFARFVAVVGETLQGLLRRRG